MNNTEDNLSENVKKHLINRLANTRDNFERAHLIRQAGFVLFQESVKKKSEDLAGAYLEEVLDSYGKVVTSVGPGSVNNYTDRVVELLKKSPRPVDLTKWKSSTLDLDDTNIENINNKCAGKYEDCRHKEATDEDVKRFCRSLKNQMHKRQMEESSSTKPPGANAYSTTEFAEKPPPPSLMNSSHYNPAATGAVAPVKPTAKPILKLDDQQSRHPSTSYARNPGNDIVKDDQVGESVPRVGFGFRTAREEMEIQNFKKYGNKNNAASSSSNYPQMPQDHQQPSSHVHYGANATNNSIPPKIQSLPQPPAQQTPLFSYGTSKKTLGTRRTVFSKFVPPIGRNSDDSAPTTQANDVPVDERLKHIEPKFIELIRNEIMSKFKPVSWDDIAGLQYAKCTIQEVVVWPMLRPDIFTGLRKPPRGILLFGPPGTGKTLIGKCIASQSKATFFSISASSLTSKWMGESEKMVRTLFTVAAVHQPSVIFIDEVDSLLCQRSETEQDCSRRIKTEFLVQLDGAMTSEDDRILIVGATNRPQELDEAARRRFIRRLYIPLPEKEARLQILRNLLRSVRHCLIEADIDSVGGMTNGYSGADMESLCREAAMEPIRSIPPEKILYFDENEVRPVSFDDFRRALNRIRASVSQKDLQQYVHWNEVYGSGTSL